MELEPFPLSDGEPFYEEGSPQWLERYEYIEARSERWLDYFRDSPEYDFTRANAYVKTVQRTVAASYENYAAGKTQLLTVQVHVKQLRDAFKRKQATVATPEERAEKLKKTEYVPKWRKDWEAKQKARREQARQDALKNQPSQDEYGFVAKRAYAGSYPEVSPMPGHNCYSVTHDEGYTEIGEKVEMARAYILVLWDLHERFYPDNTNRPDELIPGYVKPKGEGEGVERKTLDDLKRDAAAKIRKAELEQIDRRLKRGKRVA